MPNPLPPEIEVVEDFPDDVRYILPRRPFGAGKAFLMIAAVLFAFGLFASFQVPRGFKHSFFQYVPLVFFGGFAVLIASFGLLILLGRNEVLLRDGKLRFSTRILLLRWSKSMDVDRLSRFTVGASPHDVRKAGPSTISQLLARLTMLKAEEEGGRSIVVASFQPREILEPLADELSARCETVRGGLSIVSPRGWNPPPPKKTPRARAATAGPRPIVSPPSTEILPNVPGRDLSDRPGTTLRHRLPLETSTGCMLVGILLVSLFWNGIVSIFVFQVVKSFQQGRPDWFQTLFLIPFVTIGLGMIGYFFWQLLIVFGVGPTRIELAEHPLRPGASVEVFVTQSGRLIRSLNALKVSLVCEEKATYQQGTATRTETKAVATTEVHVADFAELPYEALFTFQVPEGAMHSFKSAHNEIGWKLVVRGDVPRWPNFKRGFPIDVHPAIPEANRS